MLIIDDLESFKIFLNEESELQFLLRLYKSLPLDSLLLVGYTQWRYNIRNMFNTQFRITPIGTGFGKNLTGEVIILCVNIYLNFRLKLKD